MFIFNCEIYDFEKRVNIVFTRNVNGEVDFRLALLS